MLLGLRGGIYLLRARTSVCCGRRKGRGIPNAENGGHTKRGDTKRENKNRVLWVSSSFEPGGEPCDDDESEVYSGLVALKQLFNE